MNASTRPPRRRKSALAGEHPAYPSSVPEQATQPQQQPTQQPEPTETAAAEPVAPVSPVDAGTRARDIDTRPAGRATADEARLRKLARDGAFGWAAAMRKADKRADEWAREMQRAREAGALPGVLREYIEEAAERVGCDPREVPAEVWRAAGLADRE